MQVKSEQLSPTKVKLSIVADQAALTDIKEGVLNQLASDVKVPGFRPGKAPANLVEKQLDPSLLQSEFLQQAINHLYVNAVQQTKLRPATQPAVSVTKFVPFSALEFTAEVEAVGEMKLPDYKKIKLAPKAVEATAKDVTEVLDNLRNRGAQKTAVKRAAKDGDEVLIDFKGVDAKTSEPIEGAEGQDYPLTLGSATFIPGFEDKLIGVEPGAETTFELTFPKDYGVKDLQSKKVQFTVTVKEVRERTLPKLDDDFAQSVGPFKTVAELKADIKKQLAAEREREAQTAYDNELLEKIASTTKATIPQSLIDEEIDRMEDEEKRDLMYRGQTWQEHLKAEGLTEEAHREQKRPAAEQRVKTGLILGEVADRENITVTPEELEIRIQLLKGQYQDQAMHAELDKPENRRDIHSRLMIEKTLDKLRSYAAK